MIFFGEIEILFGKIFVTFVDFFDVFDARENEEVFDDVFDAVNWIINTVKFLLAGVTEVDDFDVAFLGF